MFFLQSLPKNLINISHERKATTILKNLLKIEVKEEFFKVMQTLKNIFWRVMHGKIMCWRSIKEA